MKVTPYVVFLIPFASRQVKSKWETACAHLRQTLRSIQNSTDGNYRAVVAGHEAPDFDVGFDSRFSFLALHHPVQVHQDPLISARLDKLTKYEAAWSHAKSAWNPSYLMKLDADDLISSRLVGWLGNFGGAAGYLVKHGWIWSSGSRHLIQKVEYLDRLCGSCLIVRNDFADKKGPFLTDFDGGTLLSVGSRVAATDQPGLVPGAGISTLLLNNCHQRYAAQFAYLGHKLSHIPFHAVVYRVHNPDSLTKGARLVHNFRMWLGSVRRTHRITARLKREFMLE